MKGNRLPRAGSQQALWSWPHTFPSVPYPAPTEALTSAFKGRPLSPLECWQEGMEASAPGDHGPLARSLRGSFQLCGSWGLPSEKK